MFSEICQSVVAVGFAGQLDLTDWYGKNTTEITDYLKDQRVKNSYSALKIFCLEIDRIAIKASGSPNKQPLSIIGLG